MCGPGGASRFDGTGWSSIGVPHAVSMVEDHFGSLWFATSQGVLRLQASEWRLFSRADGLSDDNVTGCVVDSKGTLWCGTNSGGVCRFTGSAWRCFVTADGLSANQVFDMVADSSGW